MPQTQKSALVLIFEGVEEVEAIVPVDLLRRAEIEVVVAGFKGPEVITGRNGIKLLPDAALNETEPDRFDLLVLPGGPGIFTLLENRELLEIIMQRDFRSQLISAICAAPKALANAGVLDNLQATSHASVREALPEPSDDAVVVSKHIITSKGAGTAIEFALKLVELLTDSKTANEVKDSIHA